MGVSDGTPYPPVAPSPPCPSPPPPGELYDQIRLQGRLPESAARFYAAEIVLVRRCAARRRPPRRPPPASVGAHQPALCLCRLRRPRAAACRCPFEPPSHARTHTTTSKNAARPPARTHRWEARCLASCARGASCTAT